MNVFINHSIFETEILTYLKVFYPFETIKLSDEEQSDFRIIVKNNVMKVAFFDVDGRCLLAVSKKVNKWSPDVDKAMTKLVKTDLKGLVYDLCSHLTKKDMPWGILSGIRPTKLAFKLLRQLKDDELVKNVLMDTYRLSKDKADMLIKVVHNESPYLVEVKNRHSVYVGIPFCPSKCSYCTFTSYRSDKYPAAFDVYADVLLKELEAGKHWLKGCHSVYVGGGTPTSLKDEDFEKIISKIRDLIGNRSIEFTVEAGRPDTITRKKLEIMWHYGVNRISINPQTMNDKTLNKIGRSHSSEDIVETFNLARRIGFDHINMDIILGLPGEDIDTVNRTMASLMALKPESITVHTLAFKRGSKLSEERIQYLKESGDILTGMIANTYAALTQSGYLPYYLYRQKNMVGNFENVGYCKPGKESVYNIQIMEEVESIIAFGAGAISKRVKEEKIHRLDQPKDLKLYIKSIDHIINKKNKFFVT